MAKRTISEMDEAVPEVIETESAAKTDLVAPELSNPYYFEDGLRKVAPYHYTYKTNVKQRWRGRGILDIFSTEFRDRPLEYYKEAIETGRVTVNDKKCESVNSTVKNGDVISHTLHRHEPAVTGEPIEVVHEDDDLIVINKPGGVPVHPAGRYLYNSVVEIMRSERDGFNPLPCNRLDRLTSGVMFIAKHPKSAVDMMWQIKNRTVKKEYIARVAGEFPAGNILCDQPILSISPKLGLNRARADGKEALTVFRRIAYYPPRNTPDEAEREETTSERERELEANMPWKKLKGFSIVRCLPLTGRTHQIRVHLQFLGHPISNDPIYCNQRVFGPSLGKGDNLAHKDEDIMERLSRMGKSEVADAIAYHEEMMESFNKRKSEKMTGQVCDVCNTPLYSDPGIHELGIYLHARKYSCEEGHWEYETGLPKWALPPPGYEDIVQDEVPDEIDPDLLAEKIARIREQDKFKDSPANWRNGSQ